MITLRILLALSAAAFLHAQSRTLDIYWVDVEGGGATLIVSPSGQSMLVDAGNPGNNDRDSRRVFDAAKAAGLKKIDMVVTTHYHGDHVGGEPALAKLIPIDKFYDHGDSIEAGNNPQTSKLWADYQAISQGKRAVVKPGDKVPLKDVNVTVVSANGEVIAKAINGGGTNEFCKDAQTKDTDKTENGRSTGMLITYGKFKFLDVGDLTWDREMMLACPVDKVGTVTLLQATHHGFVNGQSGAPALIWALKPQVVIVNNGPRKGLEGNAWDTITKISGLEDVWQIHRALKNDAAHNTKDDQIANFEETADCKGQWLKASVSKDGKFTVTNGRNQMSRTYLAR
ncbi:MAG: MBL fold metallo-hydrolase [Terriglobia bacterium]|nr:MAG: MBL fold metallo-hydrolase [Terriglobia bacterium]